MPSQYDNNYHYKYSEPNYDSLDDKLKAQLIHEADVVFEVTPPREPTRAEELQYQDW